MNEPSKQPPPSKPESVFDLEKLKQEARNWWGFFRERLQDIPGNHMVIGKSFMQRGEFKEASYRFRMVKWFRPKHVEATALLAEAYAKIDELAKAKQCLAELKRLDPASPHILAVSHMIIEASKPKTPAPTSMPAAQPEAATPPHT